MKKSDVKRKKVALPAFVFYRSGMEEPVRKESCFSARKRSGLSETGGRSRSGLPMRIAAVPFNVLRTEMDAPLKIPETESDAPSHISAAPVGDEYFCSMDLLLCRYDLRLCGLLRNGTCLVRSLRILIHILQRRISSLKFLK